MKTLNSPLSNSQFLRGCNIARKYLKLLGFDPALFDSFSKRQKHLLLVREWGKPIVTAEKERSVPGKYLKMFRHEIYEFLTNELLGDPEDKLTIMDMMTFGLEFGANFHNLFKEGVFKGNPNEDVLEALSKKFHTNDWELNGWHKMDSYVEYLTDLVSQPNFRTYFSSSTIALRPGGQVPVVKFTIASAECQTIYFTRNNERRIAFNIWEYDALNYKPKNAYVKHCELFPKHSKNQKKYQLFIQSHAIQRFKERMDVLEPTERNAVLRSSFLSKLSPINIDGFEAMFACRIESVIVGYFTFVLERDICLITTFLPIVSDRTVRGKCFNALFNLDKEELNHLGMDKLSFFANINFDQIPILKAGLVFCDMWPIRKLLELALKGTKEEKLLNIESRTQFVASYFEKLQERRREMELPEILPQEMIDNLTALTDKFDKKQDEQAKKEEKEEKEEKELN